MASCSKQIVFQFRNIVRKPSNLYCVRPGQGLLEGKKNVQYWQCKSMSSDDGGKKRTGDGEKIKASKSEEKGDKNNSSDKLNHLLQSILRDTDKRKDGEKSGEGVKLAVPVREKDEKRKKSKKGKGSTEDPQEIKLGKRVLAAVKKVAESVGGDAVQIENELVNKLKSASTPKAKLSEIFEGMTVEGEKTAAEDRTTSVDLRELETSRATRVHRLMKDMPVSRSARFTDSASGEEDGDQRRRSRRPPQSFSDQPQYYKVDLFGARPLGIFDPVDNTKQPTERTLLLKTWDSLYQKELKMLVTNPPANGFEEMILWTEQKKLWRFPIDNEQGLTEEAKYSFEDHVFLENQIESWCPPKGPVRNFMELVCVGLSKNSYLTVPEKREYLAWYQDYFKGKSAVLKQTGAGEVK